MNQLVPASSLREQPLDFFLRVLTIHRFLNGRTNSLHYIYTFSKRGEKRLFP